MSAETEFELSAWAEDYLAQFDDATAAKMRGRIGEVGEFNFLTEQYEAEVQLGLRPEPFAPPSEPIDIRQSIGNMRGVDPDTLALRLAIVVAGNADILRQLPNDARLALASMASDLGDEGPSPEREFLLTAVCEIEPEPDRSSVVDLAAFRTPPMARPIELDRRGPSDDAPGYR